jgi:hypothetical protein
MQDFKRFGIKRRIYPDKNYNALWSNLKTLRFGEGVASQLDPEKSEFYDVSIANKCVTGKCPFCYVAASPNGKYYDNICDTWKKLMSQYTEKVGFDPKDEVLVEFFATMFSKKTEPSKMDLAFARIFLSRVDNEFVTKITYTDKPFQIAIGSEGEPTEHPQFCAFLKTVYETNVVPNYTTNGVILSLAGCEEGESVSDLEYDWSEGEMHSMIARAWELLDYTSKYVGGVAVSYSNKKLHKYARRAVNALIKYGNTNINIHHIISDMQSVDDFIKIAEEYGDEIKYHVLLPLMPSGRSKEGMDPEAFKYLEQQIIEHKIDNVAFGANFSPYLNDSEIKTWNYPPESLSKNMLLTPDVVKITPSSFNLTPCKLIKV